MIKPTPNTVQHSFIKFLNNQFNTAQYFHGMKKIVACMVLLAFATGAFAQYTLRVVINDVATRKLDDIYVAGSFNGWNPADASAKMKQFGNTRKLLVLSNIAGGIYEFKFTRGSWDKTETTATGADIANHVIEVKGDTTVSFSVAGWHDDYPEKIKPNTASDRVHIIDTAFFMPQLNRHRRIWIYLPAGYDAEKNKSYPVLYMHDGQNLFNEQTAPYGEWGIDECLDTLQKKMNKPCIVVGIDHGGDKRLNEYNPYDNAQYGKGEGAAYASFLVQTLKPFVDGNYRTLKDAENTFIAGSSMGGLISFYTILQYPDVFGKAGIFSPSFWIVPQLYDDVPKTIFKNMHYFFLYAGGKESKSMIDDAKRMTDALHKINHTRVTEVIYPNGQHNEKNWQLYFDDFYTWLMQ